MILLISILIGLIAGLVRASIHGHKLKTITLKHEWLVLVGILPQLIAFQIPWTSSSFPDKLVPFILVPSQILLLVFAWLNRKQPGFWVLSFGLLLNLSVILANGGFMPISPATIKQLLPGNDLSYQIGQRLGTTKDIILPEVATTLYSLSDRFILPEWTHYRVAFSFGDVVIAIGTFSLFWSLGSPITENKEIRNDVHKQSQPDHVRTR
ncbi:MAG: DUF5317 domain-containing protein [Anaerolineaceae bacterium]|nr:DUF5317 domain-containing protein [Anaerolineaceae bacterium]